MSKMPLLWHGFLCPKCPYCGMGFYVQNALTVAWIFMSKMPLLWHGFFQGQNALHTFIPSYLWGGSIIAPSAEATKPGPLRDPMQTTLVSIYLSFWQTSVK